ncbi:MAG: hypothetical protein F4014_05820 [Gemmatimonadetes bacterium]|nr:hypothetical protein [Gemmatimonadota bacterium]MYK98330.1 hypothetical protein [Gemmatimonadota bacterium]
MRILRRFFLIPFLVCCLSPLHASTASQEVTGRQETSARQEVLTGQETSVRQESSARQEAGARLLVVDYAMAYPEEHARMIRAFSEAGFDVDYRPYYPAMVERDARDYDAIVLLGGGDPGMSIQEVDLAINFVSRGRVLVLALPSDGPYGERRKVNPGVHDRYQFNEVLARLDINLHALNADHETGPVLNPVVDFKLAAGHPVGQGLDGSVAARAGTRLLVGDGADPLLLEPEGPPLEEETEPEPAPEPEYRVVRRTLRIPPAGAVPGEEVELLLRGDQELRPSLYYRNREPVPVDWTTARFSGRVEVVSDAKDTLTVRMSGNRWGSEYALVGVPMGIIAAAFADREIREEIRSASDLASMRDDEETFGRLAVAAAGRTGRLNEGFVLAVDRQVLSGLDRPLPPLGIPTVEAGPEGIPKGLEGFLGGFARYVRALVDAPRDWSPDHGYATAQMPGNRKPDISLNNVSVGAVLPERVRVVRSAEAGRGDRGSAAANAASVSDPAVGAEPADVEAAVAEPAVAADAVPLRGVWDFVARRHEHMGDLAGMLPGLGMDFLWTVAPAASYTGGAVATGDVRFESWALPILNRLGGTTTAWYAGVSAPREGEITGDYEAARDARGDAVGLPSRLDMVYLNRHLFEPARAIARHSRGQRALKAIVHDWEPHITRPAEAYAATDAFDDLHFQYFIRHLVRNGLYHGDEFRSLMGLDREDRFEWLLKSGYLETYIQLQEANAERLGVLYRQSMDEINPGLRHGAFVRSLRMNWFRLGFWRGAGTPERPFLVFSYERPPDWYAGFLRDRGISARVIPVGLLGLMGGEDLQDLLRKAAGRGGYALERGIWLVADPGEESGLNTPPGGMTREVLLEAVREGDGE